ncbi:MAG: hypothetical protein QXG81_02255, partial [Ignisphaera sp.]
VATVAIIIHGVAPGYFAINSIDVMNSFSSSLQSIGGFLKNSIRDFIGNLFSCATCTYDHKDCIIIPGKYCNGTGVFSREMMIYGGTNGSWIDRIYLRTSIVPVPNNYAYAIAHSLRQRVGISVNIDEQHLYTIILRIIRHTPVKERCSSEECVKIYRVPSDEAIAFLVLKNGSGISIYVAKFNGSRVVSISAARYLVYSREIVLENRRSIRDEVKSRLNITENDIERLGIPTEVVEKLIVYRYKLDLNSLGKEYTTIDGINIDPAMAPGPVLYELRSQIATGSIVYAETILRIETYWSPVIGVIVSAIDRSECKSYTPTMLVSDCYHKVYLTASTVEGEAYGKYVLIVGILPPIYITYCAGAKMAVNRTTGLPIVGNTRVCWWLGSPPPSPRGSTGCKDMCPVCIYG